MSEDKEKYRIWTDKELMATVFPPELEPEYRRGYHDGYYAAIDHYSALLKSRDYRVVFNLLWDFWNNTLRKWWHGDTNTEVWPPTPDLKIGAGYRDPKNRQMVYERDDGFCQICRRPIGNDKWEIDHIRPVSAGGEDIPENWQLTHAVCNRKKGGRR